MPEHPAVSASQLYDLRAVRLVLQCSSRCALLLYLHSRVNSLPTHIIALNVQKIDLGFVCSHAGVSDVTLCACRLQAPLWRSLTMMRTPAWFVREVMFLFWGHMVSFHRCQIINC